MCGLDIGAGDVAFLAARMVGSSGEIVSIGREITMVEHAQLGAKAADVKNVTFQWSLDQADALGQFDIVVGRFDGFPA
jgi:ubiquinone/menaquinone biosynthesis C-methylase UbiE